MARTPEQLAWDGLKDAAKGTALIMYRVENIATNAMPDVVGKNDLGTVFWLENKALREWPKRETTIALKGAFRPGQLSWARQWNLKKGHSFVPLKVEKEYYLFKPQLHDEKQLDEMTKSELEAAAIVKGKKEIINYLENLK